MGKQLFYLVALCLFIFSIVPVSASWDSINYPYANDVLTYSARIPLNVSSTGSTGCYMNYITSNGQVNNNQPILCNGITLVDLPSAEGTYNITVWDDAADSETIIVTVDKPSGILVTAIYVLTFGILLSMLFIFILVLSRTATARMTIYDVAKSWTAYFGLLVSYQLALEYANVPFVISWLDLIQSIGGWVMIALPLIGFFVTFFVKGTEKKKLPSIEEMTGSPDERRRYD